SGWEPPARRKGRPGAMAGGAGRARKWREETAKQRADKYAACSPPTAEGTTPSSHTASGRWRVGAGNQEGAQARRLLRGANRPKLVDQRDASASAKIRTDRPRVRDPRTECGASRYNSREVRPCLSPRM